MKGLLIKDLYVISGQMRFFCIFALVMAALPGTSSSFALVYAAVLPYTVLAYDERSKWDQLAAMMPYSTRDIVLGKYVLGWICVGGVGSVTLVVKLFLSRGTDLSPVLLAVCASLLTLDLVLPFMLRFGVEKGRIIFIMLIMGVGAFCAAAFTGMAENSLGGFAFNLILPAITVVGTLLSLYISIKVYPKRCR